MCLSCKRKVCKDQSSVSPENNRHVDSVSSASSPEDDVFDDSNFRRLYVSGLPSTITEDEVKTYFKIWGEIEECFLTRSATTILCYLSFAFANSIDAIQACRPHRIRQSFVQTRRILPDSQPIKKLYVGGIKGGTTTGHIFAAFSCFGHVRAVDMIKDKTTGRCRGFCFVSFDDYDCVDKCFLAAPLVINRKVVRIQKAIPASEMIKTSNPNNERLCSEHGTKNDLKARISTSSTDTGFSEGSPSPFSGQPFNFQPMYCPKPSFVPLQRTPLGSSDSKPIPHYSPLVYKGFHTKATPVGFCPSSFPGPNYQLHRNLLPYLNVTPTTPSSLPRTVPLPYLHYPNPLILNSTQTSAYPSSYLTYPNVPYLNPRLPFAHNPTSVSSTQIPLAPPIYVPISTMSNYTSSRPPFANPCQNPFS